MSDFGERGFRPAVGFETFVPANNHVAVLVKLIDPLSSDVKIVIPGLEFKPEDSEKTEDDCVNRIFSSSHPQFKPGDKPVIKSEFTQLAEKLMYYDPRVKREMEERQKDAASGKYLKSGSAPAPRIPLEGMLLLEHYMIAGVI